MIGPKPITTIPMKEDNILHLILASSSPRRREIFTAVKLQYEVIVSDVDEATVTAKSCRELAIKTAFAKACAVESLCAEGTLIVAADTMVCMDNKVYGKPGSAEQAVKTLRSLSGRTHSVITGLAVLEAGKSCLMDAVETAVEMNELSDQQIREYVDSGEPLDKAGAYGIQGSKLRVVRRIEGDYFNVVGLPIKRVLEMLSLSMDVSSHQAELPSLLHSSLVPKWIREESEVL